MEGVILSLTQFFHELVALPESLWQQYPITIGAILFLAAGSTLWQSWKSKKLQKDVDHTIDELVDRIKTSRELFLHQLRMIGIIDQRERLVLDGKYGPGIASDVSLAKVVTRLMLEHFSSSEKLARDIVDHFMLGSKLKFEKRRGYLEAFWHQINLQFSDRMSEEITDQTLLNEAISQRRGYYLRAEDVRLAYVANQKEKSRADKRQQAFRIAYGVQKTLWQVWSGVVQTAFWATINRLKAKTAGSPAKADSL